MFGKKIFTVLLAVLLSGTVLAAVLAITFGANVINLVSLFSPSASVGQPDTLSFYYAGSSAWTKDILNAVAFEDFDANGSLDLVVNSVSGDCTFYGVVKATQPTGLDNHTVLSNLDGLAVNQTQFLYWAVKPNNVGVKDCRLDYNVSII